MAKKFTLNVYKRTARARSKRLRELGINYGSEGTAITAGAVVYGVSGEYLSLTGGTISGSLFVTGIIEAGSSMYVGGNTILNGDATTINGETTINDTLTVAGMTTLNGGLTLNSVLYSQGLYIVSGNDTIAYIDANGTADFVSVVTSGPATIGGATTINNTLTVGREGAFNGNTVVYGTLLVDDDLTVRGDNLTAEYNLKVKGETTLNKATTINDTLTVASYVYGSNFYATSDERKKSDIQRITDDAVERASKVEAREYDLDGRRFGYVAQDVRRVLPSLVSEGEDGYLSLDYLSMLTLKNEALERRVQTIENQISALAARLEKLENVGR